MNDAFYRIHVYHEIRAYCTGGWSGGGALKLLVHEYV